MTVIHLTDHHTHETRTMPVEHYVDEYALTWKEQLHLYTHGRHDTTHTTAHLEVHHD